MPGRNLLTSPFYVQTPVIQVTIGNYTFGKYDKSKSGMQKYPNYIEGLNIVKVNGKVNTYTLTLIYPLTEYADPNYFEKVFSSVSLSRKISFIYGDASASNFMYRNEEAIITDVKSRFNLDSGNIQYTVSAVGQGALSLSGVYNFPAAYKQPSKVIEEILQSPEYKLQDLFTGMKNMTLVNTYGLIPHNDVARNIEKKDNLSILDYLQYLVNLMNPSTKTADKSSVYILTFVDDTSGVFNGSYFKIIQVDSNIEHPEAYELYLGYPGSNYVYNFQVENDESYSLLYNYQQQLHPQEYVSRINANGDYEEVFAPMISSNDPTHSTKEDAKTWWAKATQYPIKASITIKGLLRPAILMTYVRIHIQIYNQEHINSGLYIITKQVDSVDSRLGYSTTLNLLRIGEA